VKEAAKLSTYQVSQRSVFSQCLGDEGSSCAAQSVVGDVERVNRAVMLGDEKQKDTKHVINSGEGLMRRIGSL